MIDEDYKGAVIAEFQYNIQCNLAPEVTIILEDGRIISILAVLDQDGNPSIGIEEERSE